MRLRPMGVVAVAAAALLSAGCGLYNDHPYALPSATAQAGVNLLQNAGFEGTGAWTPGEPAAFRISGDHARSGRQSGELRGTKQGVAASQPIADGTSIPEFVSGFYRLDEWKTPAGADADIGFRVTVQAGGTDFIVHFVIGGLQAAPEGVPGNERYVFLSRSAPVVGGWTYFGYPVASAFKDKFGLAAAGVQGVDMAIELSGDGTQAWFDDIYVGPQAGNPNRP